MGVPAGYFSAHTYKSVKGTEWKKATLMTALLWPGVVVSAFFVLNFFIWGQASSGAMPFGTMLALLLMWFGISTPLVFVGAFFGFKAKITDPPTRTNEIPRQARPTATSRPHPHHTPHTTHHTPHTTHHTPPYPPCTHPSAAAAASASASASSPA